jgi:N-acetylneuraminic acid mutarotase
MKAYDRVLYSVFLIVVCFSSVSVLENKANDSITTPIPRAGHNMVYDPIKDEIIMFGGIKDNQNSAETYLNDTWIYNFRENYWIKMVTTSHPSNRNAAGMVYEPINHRILLLGGANQYEFLNDTWELDLNTNQWNKIITGVNPPRLADAEMIFDEVNEEIVMFGGYKPSGYSDETWIFNINDDTWTELDLTIHPSSRYGHRLVYSSGKNIGILFGGHAYDTDDTVNNDLWYYNCSTKQWTEQTVDSPPPTRYWHDMVYDETNEKIVLFGGRISGYSMNCRGDTWEFNEETSNWVEIDSEQNPEARMLPSMVYNEKNGKVFMFGGSQDPSITLFNDLWEFDTGKSEWNKIEVGKTNGFVITSVISILCFITIVKRIIRRK